METKKVILGYRDDKTFDEMLDELIVYDAKIDGDMAIITTCTEYNNFNKLNSHVVTVPIDMLCGYNSKIRTDGYVDKRYISLYTSRLQTIYKHYNSIDLPSFMPGDKVKFINSELYGDKEHTLLLKIWREGMYVVMLDGIYDTSYSTYLFKKVEKEKELDMSVGKVKGDLVIFKNGMFNSAESVKYEVLDVIGNNIKLKDVSILIDAALVEKVGHVEKEEEKDNSSITDMLNTFNDEQLKKATEKIIKMLDSGIFKELSYEMDKDNNNAELRRTKTKHHAEHPESPPKETHTAVDTEDTEQHVTVDDMSYGVEYVARSKSDSRSTIKIIKINLHGIDFILYEKIGYMLEEYDCVFSKTNVDKNVVLENLSDIMVVTGITDDKIITTLGNQYHKDDVFYVIESLYKCKWIHNSDIFLPTTDNVDETITVGKELVTLKEVETDIKNAPYDTELTLRYGDGMETKLYRTIISGVEYFAIEKKGKNKNVITEKSILKSRYLEGGVTNNDIVIAFKSTASGEIVINDVTNLTNGEEYYALFTYDAVDSMDIGTLTYKAPVYDLKEIKSNVPDDSYLKYPFGGEKPLSMKLIEDLIDRKIAENNKKILGKL